MTLRLARTVRHSLAHNGGRMTTDLTETAKQMTKSKKGFPFEVLGDRINITVENVHDLFKLLKAPVVELTKLALGKLP
ncbi:MAG: hypothetical protein QM775_29105 [Pirellulales bacterium]